MLKEYTVCIKETLKKMVTIYAHSPEMAEYTIREQYKNGDIVLDYNDYISTDLEVINAAN